MKNRIAELDWLKAVCIMLMVAFHLVFIEAKYPMAKEFVYLFHMPVFLLISGWLMSIRKSPKAFGRSIAALIVPYAIMEALYIVAASVLPINEHIDNLTVGVFLTKLFLHPIGPYWFLHTLALLSLLNYLSAKITYDSSAQEPNDVIKTVPLRTPRTTPLPLSTPLLRLVARRVCLFVLMAYMLKLCGILSFGLAMYYLAGVVIKMLGQTIPNFFRPRFWVLPVVFIAGLLPFEEVTRDSIPGIIVNYAVILILLSIFRYMPKRIIATTSLIGRETLAILLFSPLFTLAAKYYQPWLCSLDPSGMLFLVVSVLLAVFGSIAIKRAMELTHTSKMMFLK